MDAPYPAEWEADVVLTDGGTIHVRPIRADDEQLLVGLHGRLSNQSVYFRFFSPRPRLTEEEVRRFTHLDYVDRMALVAILGDELVAVARYDRGQPPDEAEVAFVVDDAHQGRGIATVLLEHLAAAARERAISRFYATVLPENRKMIGVFRAAGFQVTSSFSEGVVEVHLDIEPTVEAVAAIEAREHVAEARSVLRLLAPRSIAVVGAGRERGTIGHEIVRNLIEHGFNGPVYPVNAAAPFVASVRTYPSVLDIPDEVDLAVIAVPAPDVPAVVEQCGQKRVQGLVVVSAGFAEAGAGTWGEEAERSLVELARRSGMRLIGPNCMGVVNTAPDVSMHATFAGVAPLPGTVGFSTQSGPLGIAVLEHARRLGMGISTFVSLGNKADVSSNDLLQYWEGDTRTDVVLLYLESFGNPRKFNRLARRVSRSKPIVAVKSGRGGAGDLSVDALLRQTGVIRVDTLEQLFDVARVLVGQPLPAGRRVAIVTNSGGAGLLAADACAGAGLEVVSTDDLTHAAGPDEYAGAIARVMADVHVDALLVLFVPPLVTRADEVTRAIGAAAFAREKTVVATVLSDVPSPSAFRSGRRVIPTFVFPEAAAHALGRVAEYAEWRALPEGSVPELPDAEVSLARGVVEGWVAAAPGWIDPEAALGLLAAYGVPTARSQVVSSPDSAVAAAERLGWPVALKAGGLLRLLKTEAGGLALDVHDEAELRRAYDTMASMLGDAMGRAVVQEMVEPGVDLVLTVHQDPSFGSLLSLGERAGASRILPLTDVDAAELVDCLDLEDVDTGSLEDLLVRIGRLGDDLPEVAELRVPLIASAKHAVAVDVRARLAPWHRPHPSGVRRLR